MELPQNADRIATQFDGLDEGRKQAVLGHLRGQKDQASLDKTIGQIIHNGGPEAELVGRIFNRPVDTGTEGGIRTVSAKPLAPIQKSPLAAGTGGPADGAIPHEEPHTSKENPPSTGHPRVLKTEGSPGQTVATRESDDNKTSDANRPTGS